MVRQTDKYVEKVQKIATDESIQVLANEVLDDVAGYRGAVVEAIDKLNVPDEPKKPKYASKILILGVVCLALPTILTFWAVNDKETNNIPDNMEFAVGSLFILGVILIIQSSRISAKHQDASKKHKNIESTIESLRELVKDLK